MKARRFPINALMGYSPSSDTESAVLHVCKMGRVVGAALECLYDAAARPTISTSYAWDDGTGKALEPLASVFEKAAIVHVISDMSPYGLVAANNVAELLNQVGAAWKHLGITEGWFEAIPAAARREWIESRRIPLPEEMQGALDHFQPGQSVLNQFNDQTLAMAKAGYVVELEAFLRPEHRDALSRIVNET